MEKTCPRCGAHAACPEEIDLVFGWRYEGTTPQSWCHDCRTRRGEFAAERVSLDVGARLGATYFASGSNHPGEILGLAECGIDVGVAIQDLHSDGEAAIAEAVTRFGVSVFVDSGAFSEVSFGPDGPYVSDRIPDDEWRARLAAYERIASDIGSALFAVAPDMIAHQIETLGRMEKFRNEIRAVAAHGANVLVPVQKGELAMSEFWELATETLGVDDPVAAVPMKKDATTTDEFAEFLAACRPGRVHLLGLGPKSSRFREVMAVARSVSPETEVFCDSVLITSLVGRSNGRGGGPRPLTAAHDEVVEFVEGGVFVGDVSPALDWTEMATRPSYWVSATGLKRVARFAGLTGSTRAAFLKDPDEWVEENWENPLVEVALEAEWAKWAKGSGSTRFRKRESLKALFMV